MNLSKTIVLSACIALILSTAMLFVGSYSFDEPGNHEAPASAVVGFDEPGNHEAPAVVMPTTVSFDEPGNHEQH